MPPLWQWYTAKYRYSLPNLALFNLVDLLGGALRRGRHNNGAKLRAEIRAGRIRKILAIRMETMGDLLLVAPALRALKANLPHAELALIIPPALQDAARRMLDVERVFTYEFFSGPRLGDGRIFPPDLAGYLRVIRQLRSQRFDLAIDFRGDVRTIFWFGFLSGARHRLAYEDISAGRFLLTHPVQYGKAAKHEIEANLDLIRALGLDVDAKGKPFFPVAAREEQRVRRLLVHAGVEPGDRLVGIHCFARWWGRRWPLERFSEVVDRLAHQPGVKVLLLGAADDLADAGRLVGITRSRPINFVGMTTIAELAALLRRLDLLLCLDSGPLHLAAAIGTPTVSLFGPDIPALWAPQGEEHTVIYKELPCSPCRQRKCVRQTNECMTSIGVEEVLQAAAGQLERAYAIGRRHSSAAS